MSKLQELLDQYCPNGVERRPISRICKITSGEFVKKDKQVENGYPVYNGGTTNTGFYGDYNTVGPKVIISARGAAGFVNYVDGPFWAGNSCHVMNIVDESLIVRYLYHVMKSLEQKIISKRQDGSIPSVSQKQLYEMSIPVPPIEVQREIVRILDSFTELTTELNTKLSDELVARRKQYEYYRDALLDFDNANPNSWLGKMMAKYCPDGVEHKPIGSFAKCYPGATPKTSQSAYWEGGTIPWMSSGEVNQGEVHYTEKKITQLGYDETSTKMVPPNTVVIALAGQGKTRGTVAMTRIPLCTNQSLCAIVTDETVLSEYLLHYLRSQYQQLREVSSGDGTRGGLNLKMINAYLVPVPPLELQREIVKVLDRFSSLCSDVSSGLPAEIAARQKQYEYYRGRLLSF